MHAIQTYDTVDQAHAAAVVLLQELIHQYRDQSVLLMTSGGSNLSLVDGLFSETLPAELTVSVLDERYDASPEINTFQQFLQLPIANRCLAEGVALIDTQLESGQTHQQHADAFEEALRRWRANNPDGVVVATLGLGEDGHISGVMPYPDQPEWFGTTFVETDRWVVGYDAQDRNPYPLRTTTTLAFLREQIDDAVLLVTGAAKKNAWESIWTQTDQLEVVPARVLHQMKRVQICVDRAADQLTDLA